MSDPSEPDASSLSPQDAPGLPGPVSLRVSTGPLAAPVLSRVVSMVLARAACPVDRLDDALILCDAISAHAPAHVHDAHLAYKLTAQDHAIELCVSELRAGGATGLIEDALLPDVGNVIERYSDTHRIEPAVDGSGEELVLTLRFA